jgi:septal ring factor EnvC (AmiA/AmiB activator)
MKTIRVHTAFDFTNPDYSQTHYAVGIHQVDDSVAGHWFTQQFAEVAGGTKEEQEQVDALFHAEITTLQGQVAELQEKATKLEEVLAERDKSLEANVQTIAERDDTITTLQGQVAELQQALAAAEGAKGGKK